MAQGAVHPTHVKASHSKNGTHGFLDRTRRFERCTSGHLQIWANPVEHKRSSKAFVAFVVGTCFLLVLVPACRSITPRTGKSAGSCFTLVGRASNRARPPQVQEPYAIAPHIQPQCRGAKSGMFSKRFVLFLYTGSLDAVVEWGRAKHEEYLVSLES